MNHQGSRKLALLAFMIPFFGVGTAFYVFYKTHPELVPLGMTNDSVFPLFISQRVPVGLAPNIEVSLVLTPDDGADLDESPGLGDRVWRAALAVGRVAARPGFGRRMRARPRPDLPEPTPSARGRRT